MAAAALGWSARRKRAFALGLVPALVVLAAVSGLLLVLARPLPEPAGIALGALSGIAVGLDSPPEVLSVREAGATTYLNFGRNWTRGFAVTISRRIVGSFEAAGIALKSLKGKRIRVRGWVEERTGATLEHIGKCSFDTELMEVPAPANPLGVRAGGEGGTTPALASVTNAIVDALAGFGVKHIEMPATPQRVWRAIHRS